MADKIARALFDQPRNVLAQYRQTQQPNALAQTMLPPFGIQKRSELYPGEDSFFRDNRHVAGMASEDNRVLLNPYSANTPHEQNAVAMNEAARIKMRQLGMTPTFQPTPQQRSVYDGTAYEGNETEMRATILARILSGDPSGGSATNEQSRFINTYLNPMEWWKTGK